jgi:hypothetical protein
MRLTKIGWLLAIGTMTLLVVMACGGCVFLDWLDNPVNQKEVIGAPHTVGGVLNTLGIPFSDAAGALTSTLLAAGFAAYNYFRAKKATAQTAQVIAHVDSSTSDIGQLNADSADLTMSKILNDPLVGELARKIIAKVTK